MKRNFAIIGIALGLLALLTLVVSCEISVWKDCRQENGWFTCMRMLSK